MILTRNTISRNRVSNLEILKDSVKSFRPNPRSRREVPGTAPTVSDAAVASLLTLASDADNMIVDCLHGWLANEHCDDMAVTAMRCRLELMFQHLDNFGASVSHADILCTDCFM